VILHPSGYVEVDYFHATAWDHEGRAVSRRTWKRHYRPDCQMIRCTLQLARRRSRKDGT
jgi:hypothetical protein